jgi:hypothetical protein
MMYGCEPCVPPAIKDRYRPGLALVFDTPQHQEQAAGYLLARAQLLQQNCSIAMTNLRSAQHRDTLRYRQVRSGLYRPPLVKFSVGEFVYVKRVKLSNTLMSDARPGIFRILEVRDSGVLVLQGKCGSTMEEHQQNCAPCMLMNIDHRLDHSLRRPGADECCVVCDSDVDEAVMLMCDGCGKGYHTYCLQPPLAGIPDAVVWLCPKCESDGVEVEPILRLREAAELARPSEAAIFPNAAQRAADAVASRLHGQVVWAGGEERVLQFVAREDRPKQYIRRPFRLEVPGEVPAWFTEAAAQKLLSQRQEVGVRQLTAAMAELGGGGSQFVAAATIAGGRWPKQITQHWDLATVDGCRQAGKELFGELEESECVALCHCYLQARVAVAEGSVVEECSAADVQVLLRAVDVRSCMRLCAPWAVTDQLQQVMTQRYAKQVASAGTELDAMLSPAFYQFMGKLEPLEWVFLLGPQGLMDLALAVAVSAATVGVACWVDASYCVSGPAHRQRTLQQLMDQGRLLLVREKGAEKVWLCVFATAGHRNSMCSLPCVGAFCQV